MTSKLRTTKEQVLMAARLKPPAHHFPRSEPHEVCPFITLNFEERQAIIRLLEYGIEGTTTPIRRASGKSLVLYNDLHKRISAVHATVIQNLIKESNRIWKATKREREKQKKLAEKQTIGT